MNDTLHALKLIRDSLVDINDRLERFEQLIAAQAKREQLRLEQTERRIDALQRRVQRLETPVSY